MKQRLLNILFWSILSAAFIGPGTITTAASAGAGFGLQLLWALTFSIVACAVLQEASARLTAVTGRSLGAGIREHLGDRPIARAVAVGIVGSIILGCIAYEAGNILGAVAGASLLFGAPVVWLALGTGLAAGLLLWFGSTQVIARLLGGVVAVMGICFLTTAVLIAPHLGEVLSGALVPRLPAGSELLVIALIGTTVVPYNIFLGSGLAHGQSIREMRLSLSIAIVLGGIVSGGVLVVGSAVAGTFTFQALADQLALQLGGWAASLLGIGLFAAGFSSAMTAALAAAIAARGLAHHGGPIPATRSDTATDRTQRRGSVAPEEPGAWRDDGRRFRAVWIAVLVIGIGFGMAGIQPIPAIILAQALNGIILPVIAVFLLFMVNDARLLGAAAINSRPHNVLTGLVVCVTLVLGLTSIGRAMGRLVAAEFVDERFFMILAGSLVLLLSWPVGRRVWRLRRGGLSDR